MVLGKGKSSKKSGLGKRQRRDRNNEKSDSGQNKATALLYSAEDLHVLPLHGKKKDGGCTCGDSACAEPGKHPRTRNGLEDATTDATLIEKRWTKWPKAKIGIATGAEMGIIAVIAKGEAGGAKMRSFGDENKTPRTVAFQTNDDDHTYLFRTKEVRLRDRLEDVAEGITVVGDDDFVVAPSQIEGFLEGRAIGKVEIADVPKGLLDLITTEPGKAVSQTLERVAVEDVESVGKHREVDPERVTTLAASMAKVGLHTPITVRRIKKGLGTTVLALVVGGHRLAAAKSLGWTHIDAFVMEGNETDARMWQLIENVHRAELTALERAESVAELVHLVRKSEKGGQNAHPGGQQPHDRGISRAAKALGFTREEVRRSLEIAGISAEAKAKAKELGLDRKQSALLKIAKQNGSDGQLAKIEEIKDSKPTAVPKASSTGAATKKSKQKSTGAAVKAPSEPDTGTGKDASSPSVVPEEDFPELPNSLDRRNENERLFASLKADWDNAPRSVRKRFVTEVLKANIEV
jgi:Bifunctional DNA primase/polymerase, N-terminal/ParB-like nuclease domain